jgi:hypothetical protein
MAHCKSCNEKITGPKSEHYCKTVRLSDGSIVKAARVEPGGDLRQKILSGDLKVVFRYGKPEPVKAIKDRFAGRKRQGSAILLEPRPK